MTQGAAQYQFYSSFGVPAYPSTSVPENAALPYLVYQPAFGYWEDSANPTLQLWMRTESEETINAIVQRIGDRIGVYAALPCDGGMIKVTRGDPWCIPANAQEEPALKLRQMNVHLDFYITK